MRHLDCNNELIASLYQDGIVSERERDVLQQIRHASQRRRKLLQILRDSTYQNGSPFDRFLHILNQTGQGALSAQLKDGRFEEDALQRQEIDWKLRLKKCYLLLSQDLLVETLFLDYLCQEGILSNENLERLTLIQSPDRTTTLLRILSHIPFFFKEGTNVGKVFIEALGLPLPSSESHLIEALNGVELTAEDFLAYESMYNFGLFGTNTKEFMQIMNCLLCPYLGIRLP